MNERLVVPVEALRRVANVLLGHLEAVEGEEVALERDMFWAISSDELFNVYAQPRSFTIGQLSESWENLEGVLDDGAQVSYGLVWLADLLRAIGHQVVR